ncbi:MAG: DUF2914 domain-containing protein [Salinibacter sp.]
MPTEPADSGRPSSDAAPSFFEAHITWLDASPRYRLARWWYVRHEELSGSLFFLGGVTWDALTLQRIDALFDNLILGVYLVLLTGFVTLAALARTNRPLSDSLRRLSAWSTGAIQFLAGSLFSAYIIYYTRSASLSAASLFLLVLVALLVANELIWRRKQSIFLLIGIYFLAVFCYFTFLLPVALGQMGFEVFLASGFVSAGLVISLLLYLDVRQVFATPRAFLGTVGLVLGLFGAVTIFYVNHWIPPVPLALQDGGVFHDAHREGDAFVLRYEKPPWHRPWQTDDDPFHYVPGDTVYCFAAVFAPTTLQTRVYHHWQYYHPEREAWVDTDRIGYRVVGGRRRGYRGVTFKQNIWPGAWRVTVETAARRPIGRIRFDVVEADSTRPTEYVTRRYQ